MSSVDLTGLDIDPSELKLPRFSPDELIGREFIRNHDDGKGYRAKVIRKILDNDAENHKNIKFLVELGEGEFDEIIQYNTLCDMIEQIDDHEEDPLQDKFIFKSIEGHQGPIKPNHPDYKGSSYNLLVRWNDDSQTYEPLDMFIKDDPITVAVYA